MQQRTELDELGWLSSLFFCVMNPEGGQQCCLKYSKLEKLIPVNKKILVNSTFSMFCGKRCFLIYAFIHTPSHQSLFAQSMMCFIENHSKPFALFESVL